MIDNWSLNEHSSQLDMWSYRRRKNHPRRGCLRTAPVAGTSSHQQLPCHGCYLRTSTNSALFNLRLLFLVMHSSSLVLAAEIRQEEVSQAEWTVGWMDGWMDRREWLMGYWGFYSARPCLYRQVLVCEISSDRIELKWRRPTRRRRSSSNSFPISNKYRECFERHTNLNGIQTKSHVNWGVALWRPCGAKEEEDAIVIRSSTEIGIVLWKCVSIDHSWNHHLISPGDRAQCLSGNAYLDRIFAPTTHSSSGCSCLIKRMRDWLIQIIQ